MLEVTDNSSVSLLLSWSDFSMQIFKKQNILVHSQEADKQDCEVMGHQGPPRQGSSYFTYSGAEQILRHTASKTKTWKGTPPLLESRESITYLVIPLPTF